MSLIFSKICEGHLIDFNYVWLKVGKRISSDIIYQRNYKKYKKKLQVLYIKNEP